MTGWRSSKHRLTVSRVDLDRVRQRLADPVALCDALGLMEGSRVQPGGVFIRCPNPKHTDPSPSCSVRIYPNGIGFRCFGCGIAGDGLALIALAKGMSTTGKDFPKVLRIAEITRFGVLCLRRCRCRLFRPVLM